MKRMLFKVFLLFSLTFALPVFADVMPYYSSSISEYTIGFLQMPNTFKVYLYPRNDSTVVDTVSLDGYVLKTSGDTLEPNEVYVVQVDNKISYCIVVDEQDGWYKILYDKKNNKFGWVKPDDDNDFLRLREFYSFYGKMFGLYYMKNVDYRKRGLYSGAYEQSQKIDGFTMVKRIKLHKISGNWALVTVIDVGSKPKIGYIRWREDNGTILVFPKIK